MSPTTTTLRPSPTSTPCSAASAAAIPAKSGTRSGTRLGVAPRNQYQSSMHHPVSLHRLDHDPVLSQYLNHTPVPKHHHHQLYFDSLSKQRTIKSYDIYARYLTRAPHSPKHSPKHIPTHSPTHTHSPIQTHTRLHQPSVSSPLTQAASPQVKRPTAPLHHPDPTKKPKPHPSSPQPRAKPLVKHVSQDFMRCPLDDLTILISRMIQSLISLNDKQVPHAISQPHLSATASTNQNTKKVLTRYHSRTPPAISPHTYLSRLSKFNNFNQATLLTTIYYIDLLSHHYQPFFTLNSWTVHRFLLVATMLAQKSMEDFFYTNDHYAKVGGVAVNELNCLEIDFLNRVDWRLVPAKHLPDGSTTIKNYKQVLDLYFDQLLSLMGQNLTTDAHGDSGVMYVAQSESDLYSDDESDDDMYDD